MKNILYSKISLVIFIIIVFIACSPEDGSNGIDGNDGFSSLISIIIEQPGAGCENGGYKINSGLDLNKNNQLDFEEINTAEFLCNAKDLNSNYVSYVSLISQEGAENPTSSILENTLEMNIVWNREEAGKFIGVLDKPIILEKTVIFYTTPTSHTGVRGEIIDENTVSLQFQNGINVFSDNFSNLSFELSQYK